MLYELGSKGLEEIKVDDKNDLPIGTVLYLDGYGGSTYVIVKNLGVSERFSGHGAKYIRVCIDGATDNINIQSQIEASSLKWIADKKDYRIQNYIMDEVKTEEEVNKIWALSEVVRENLEGIKKHDDEIRAAQINKGRELFNKHIPEDAKALIIAECHKDESDIQSDYFGRSTTKTVILGYSKYTRDLFPEMRKHAAKIPETAHLAIPPEVDTNGDKKTDDNKDWWTPSDEHRDNYSMGAGYYLKTGWINSSGWCISKARIYEGRMNEFYLSLGEQCVFEGLK